MDQLLLTPAEAADALRVGRSTLFELLRSGALQSVKIGHLRRVPTGALERYVVKLSKSQ